MSSFARELLAVDRQRVDLRAGVLGLVVLSVLAVAIAVVGPQALAAVIGALVALSTDPLPARRSWGRMLLPLLVAGTVLTYLAVWISGRAVPAALLAGGVGVAATLHAGDSPRAETRGLITTLWTIIALTLYVTGVGALAYAVGFAAGALAGAGVALYRARPAAGEGGGVEDLEAGRAPTASVPPPFTVRARLASPIVGFALLRGLGLAIAVLLGFTWFPAHPAWVAITTVLVMRPPTRQALAVGLQRSLGTGAGVVVAVALADVVGRNTPALVLLLLASAFGMMALREVNYALFAMLITTLVVYTQRILGADAAESGRDRLLETILGVAIAFAVLGLNQALDRTRKQAA